jgi:hypothetical protein
MDIHHPTHVGWIKYAVGIPISNPQPVYIKLNRQVRTSGTGTQESGSRAAQSLDRQSRLATPKPTSVLERHPKKRSLPKRLPLEHG